MIKIRAANTADEKIVFKIHKHSVECGCSGHYTKDQIKSWAVPQGLPPFEELLANRIFAVAEYNGRCVGFGSAEKNSSQIVTLFVEPNFFGNGIGTKILAFLEEKIAETGSTQVWLDSSLNAVTFYQKNGYQIHSNTSHTEPDGTKIQCVKMEKSLEITKMPEKS